MSDFTQSTYSAEKAAGGAVPVFRAGAANNQVPISDFAPKSAVDDINGKIPSGASSSNKLATAQDLASISAVIPSGASSSNKLATGNDVANSIGKVKDGGSLTDGATVSVPNNSVSTLSSSQASLTLNVELAAGEIPNFAVEITAGAAITLTVTKTTGGVATTLKYAEAAGNALESGKFYQVTCVGSCWTLAEFVVPTP